MTSHRIVPLYVGSLAEVDRCAFLEGTPPGVTLTPPCIAWLVEDGERAALVDTGPGDPARAAGHHPPLEQGGDDTLTAALARAGCAASDLDLVLLSHLHWDHVGGLAEVPDVVVLVQASELRAAVDPVASQRATYEIGLRGIRPPWVDALDRIEAVHGDREVWPGLSLIPLPGHTPGSQGVLVHTQRREHLITGDALPLFENWSDDPARRVPNGIHTDLDAYQRSFDTIERLGAVPLPGHDPRVFDHAQYPALTAADRKEGA